MGIRDFFDRKRQSGPRPTAEEYLAGMGETEAATNAALALSEPVGVEQIRQADTLLNKYKQKKASLETRIKDNEKWYKMRHIGRRVDRSGQIDPKSGWLFNMIANKHAEAMDNYPHPLIQPREQGDEPEAKMLSSIIPEVLEQIEFEETYSDVQMYKLKSGTGVYGVTWDPKKLNGLGDISVRKIDLLNLFWAPGVLDIQESPNLFYVSYQDSDMLLSQYPQLQGKTGTGGFTIEQYGGDDQIDTSDKTVVVDWYYKRNVNGRNVLHYCKYANGVVLYATENDPETRERGLYDHGLYPFVFETLYKTEGTPAGFGFIDVAKDAQEFIDHGNAAILENTLAGARPRYFERVDGAINAEEFADFTKTIIHVNGNLDDNSIRPIDNYPLPSIYVNVIADKVNELKEVTGNRDVATGGTEGGVTAASGIAAMQEAGAKLTRDMNKASYRAFRKIVSMMIELIRQFYDAERTFRIIGDQGAAEYISYSNSGLRMQQTGVDSAGNPTYRLPVFDIKISAEKESPYTRMAHNEMILDFSNRGFFAPQMADQAIMTITAMDIDDKDKLLAMIRQNGTMFEQMQMLAAMLDRALGTNEYSVSLAQQYGIAPPQGVEKATPEEKRGGESATTAKARERVARSTEI